MGEPQQDKQNLEAAQPPVIAESDGLRRALVHIAHVLGAAADPEPREWKCGNNCEGCRYEMAEASLTALEALGFATYKAMLDAFDSESLSPFTGELGSPPDSSGGASSGSGVDGG